MNTYQKMIMSGVTGPGIISNGSATNFEFDSFTGWTADDLVNGVTTQETFDGKSTFKLDGGAIYASNNKASRYKVLAVPAGDRDVVTMCLYHDSLGASTAAGGGGGVNFLFQPATGYYLAMIIWSNKITIRNWAGSDVIIGAVTPSIGAWYKITLDITGLTSPATAICDFYKDETLIDTAIECTRTGALGAAGHTAPQQISRETSPYVQRISYLDRILYGDGLA